MQHDVGKVRRLLERLGPGAAEGLNHRRGHPIGLVRRGQDVEGNDVILARGIDVNEALSHHRVIEHPLGDQKPEEVVTQERMGVQQPAAATGGDVLVDEVLQELALAHAADANGVAMGIARGLGEAAKRRQAGPAQPA